MAELQFNKITMIRLGKELIIRQNALPILQSKEAALRAETRKVRKRIKELKAEITAKLEELDPIKRMWGEFPDIVKIKDVKYASRKIASVQVKVMEDIEFDTGGFSIFANPSWFLEGAELIKEVLRLKFRAENEEKLLEEIEYARRKTTQKVNLYEKVQIPSFEESIRKIKRYLEDEENLSKSSQKILKKRMEFAS